MRNAHVWLAVSLTACGSSTTPSAATDAATDTATDAATSDAAAGGDSVTMPEASGDDATTTVSDSASEAATPSWKTPVGTPPWEPFGGYLSSTTIGTASDGYAAGRTNTETLFEGLHKFYPATSAFGPGTAHAGPYETEIDRLYAKHSVVTKTTFSVAEFTSPQAVISYVIIVPKAGSPSGSSPDSPSGPIIANSLFSLQSSAPLWRNGVLYDPDSTAQYPAMKAFGFTVDGASHILFTFGDNSSFGPSGTPPTGDYEWRIRMRDGNGDGWDLHIPFTVK